MDISKKFLLVFLVVLLAGVIFGWGWYSKNRVIAKEFIGTVKSVEGNAIVVEGVYSTPDQPELMQADKRKTIQIMADEETKLVKESLYLPSAEELKDTGGRYDPSKLKREESAGSLEDLKAENISIRAKSDINVYGSEFFTASEIRYIEPVYPD